MYAFDFRVHVKIASRIVSYRIADKSIATVSRTVVLSCPVYSKHGNAEFCMLEQLH